MKAAITFFLVISITTFSFAQDNTKGNKTKTVSFGVVNKTMTNSIQGNTGKDTKMARVYMFRNSRVKKALAFKTKRNRSKMA